MPNALLLAAARSPRAQRLISTAPVVRRVVDRFVAGESLADAVRAAHRLVDAGLTVSLDHLGEHTDSRQQSAAAADACIDALRQLGELGLAPSAEVSIKLSALGQALPDGQSLALSAARRICVAAADVGTTVTVDMEDSTTVCATLATVRELRQDFPWVGAVLQSALFRTEQDCRDLAQAGSRVRLVKGAYAEPATVAHQSRRAVDAAYERCLEILMAGPGYPMVATHDPALIARTQQLAAEHQRTPGSYEFQMLYGIRAAEQARLAAEGHRVRIYVPYGDDWYGYFMRRLAERPANLTFFLRSFLPS